MEPQISVVVPSHDRPARLRLLLDSLRRQTLRDDRFEVVVAHDSSGSETADLLRSHPLAEAGTLRELAFPPGPGPAAKRNAGWRAARAPLVAFTDDDCEADPGWLEALLKMHEERPEAVIQGRTEPRPAERHLISAFSRSIQIDRESTWYETCNMAYPRALLERLGGLDEEFGLGAGDDTDLGWRARETGAQVVFLPAALVYHAVHVQGALSLARAAGRWRGVPLAVRRHPGLRRACPWRVFWTDAHERLALAGIGVLLARRTRGLSLALAAPYVQLQRPVHNSLPGTLASLPAHVLVDLAETREIVLGSISARTVLV